MIYSSRLKKILHYTLSHRDRYVTLDELTQLLKISRRTLFRELQNIDQDLESYDLKLIRSGAGIHIEGSEAAQDELLCELQTQGIAYINKEERQHLLMFELLRSCEITKLLHYANMFQVSEATISNDLDLMEPWFEEHALKLIRKPGLGVEVVGSECDMRSAMTILLHESLRKNNACDHVNYLDAQTLLHEIFIREESGSIMRLLNQDILERILQVFHTYQHELSLDRYAQSSYIGLIIHLVIAVDRIVKKEEIVDNEQVVTMIKDDVSYLQAEKMAQYLELEFDIDIPDTEIAFIALHIRGSKITNIEYRDVKEAEVTQLTALVQDILNGYDEDIRMQLVEDEQLLHGLVTHLEPTLIRLKHHLPIYNPLLKQIKEEYQDLYAQSKRACACITERCGCAISDDEIGFITMHIGASLERNLHSTHNMRTVTIGVVCASGIGVSALLSARISKIFANSVRIIPLSMEETARGAYHDCELLVSTFPVDDVDVDVYCVSPLLNADDISRLKTAITEIAEKEVVTQRHDENDTALQVKQIQTMCTYILEILEHVHISFHQDDVTCDEIMRYAGDVYGSDKTKAALLYEALFQREQLASVIMKDYGFAMYHALSEGIDHSVIHVVYPKGACFTEGNLKDLHFVIILLDSKTKQPEKQKLMSMASRGLIEQDAYYKAIMRRDEKGMIQELGNILKEYLMTWLEDTL